MNETEVAWSAGLVEGEGCLIQSAKTSITIQVHMTDLDVLEKLKDIWEGNLYTVNRSDAKPHWKPSWVWTLSGARAALMLELLLPYFGQRRSLKAIEILSNYNAPRQARAKRKEKARLLYSQGMSYKSIATELGIAYSTVRDDIKGRRKK